MPLGTDAAAVEGGALLIADFANCSATDSASDTRATSKSSPRRRRSITSLSCASLRMRGKFRSLRLSLSWPSTSRALVRTTLARTAASPEVRAATVRRRRSNASSRVRRSPVAPIGSAGAGCGGRSGRGPRSGRAERVGGVTAGTANASAPSTGALGAAAATGDGTPASIAIAASPSSGSSPGRSVRGRSSRSRPRPRRPRRPRLPTALSPAASAGASVRAASSAAAFSAARASPFAPLGRPISSWPFSSFVAERRPRCTASCTKRENFAIPRSFSSNELSISCMTCFRRSERMTSPLRFMRLTASVTSSQGSHFLAGSSSLFFTRPARAL